MRILGHKLRVSQRVNLLYRNRNIFLVIVNKNVLLLADTSYAGMGPYVANIVNSFSNTDDIRFFLVENEQKFYTDQIKVDLHSKATFFLKPENKVKSLFHLVFPIYPPYYSNLIADCKKYHIKFVHILTGSCHPQLLVGLHKHGIKVLNTVHDLHPHEAKKSFLQMLKHHLFYHRVYQVLKLSDAFVTNSIVQKKELEAKKSKLSFYHDFPSLVTESIIKGRKKPKELSYDNYILFFGRIEEYKGVELLYNAFYNSNLCSKERLVIAGNGTIAFQRKEDETEKNILVINRFIDDSEVQYLYSHAKCVVYPYLSATQSGVLSLAYYFNVPVLCSDVPFFKSIIEYSQGGMLFKHGDKMDLMVQLSFLCNADNSKMKMNQVAYYNDYYQIDKIHKKMLSIYESFIYS